MKPQKKLNEVFTDFLTNGIFKSLQSFDVPWKNENIDGVLDLDFFTNYAGEKTISPALNALLDEDGELSALNQAKLASLIYNKFKINWIREYQVLLAEYNPIENYSMVETHTGSDTRTETPEDWVKTETQTPNQWKQTETQTPTDWKETKTDTPTDWKETKTDTPTDWKETETQTPTNWKETTKGLQADNVADAENSVYAFNSSDPVKISESEAKTSSKSEVERTGTYETETERTGTYQTEVERSGSYETETERTGTYQTETSHTGTYETTSEQSGTYESKTEYDTELTRSGNIGVTTSVQMLRDHADFWSNWNFFQNVVFPDVSSIMALKIYQ